MILDLKKLIELQEIDLKIHELKVSSQEFPQKVNELERLIEQAHAKTESIAARLKDIATEKTDLNDKITKAQTSLERSQDRLNSITTNREYDAVHGEIETHRQIGERARHRITDIEKDVDSLTQALAEAQAEEQKIRDEHSPLINELNEKIASIDSLVAEQTKLRDAVLPDINKQFVRTYEHVLKGRKKGKVLSLVYPGDRTCSVCFKVLEPQLINELRRGNRLTVCQSCGSLMIWVDEAAAPQVDQ